MPEEPKNYLGIDWGASKVGVAFADSETRMAFPFSTLSNDRNLSYTLKDIIDSKDVGIVVIGIPSHVNREDVLYGGEKLAAALEKLVPIRIAFQNEMFTTKMAKENLKERGVRHIARYDDAEAARIILQEWLDKV
ncbi:MAG: pre-16S rRNA-processing nuclease YqgF [Candidatus Moranbacteria bacterium]|nr:pre-16S rRNA-processing nuclease YqgF [Candidatus Moranbacteria bacterium]